MGRLTPLGVKNAKLGRHCDGKGLYLLAKPSGAKSWLLRVVVAGRRMDIGLGSTDWVTLAEARDKAYVLRKHAKEGRDPVAERDRGKLVVPTFAEAAVKAHLELSRGWSEKTAAAFKTSLDTHAVPKIGKHRIDQVGSEQIIAALAPIWTTKPEVAKKVRVRILQVLQFAKSKGWRTDALPRRGISAAGSPSSRAAATSPQCRLWDTRVRGRRVTQKKKLRPGWRCSLLSPVSTYGSDRGVD